MGCVFIAGANVDQSDGESCDSLQFDRVCGVQDYGREVFQKVFSLGASVGQGEADQGAHLDNLLGLGVLKSFMEDSVDGVTLILYSRVDDSDSNVCSSHNVFILDIAILIDVGETLINIPEHEHSEGSSSSKLSMILVLMDPIISTLSC